MDIMKELREWVVYGLASFFLFLLLVGGLEYFDIQIVPRIYKTMVAFFGLAFLCASMVCFGIAIGITKKYTNQETNQKNGEKK